MKNMLKGWLQQVIVQRLLVLLFFGLFLYSLGNMIHLLLLLFLITYVMGRVQQFISDTLAIFMRVNDQLITVFLYTLLFVTFIFGIYRYWPQACEQIEQLTYELKKFFYSPKEDELSVWVAHLLEKIEFKTYLPNGLKYILKLGDWIKTTMLATLLSFFFLLQKKEIVFFTSKFKQSKISPFYIEASYLSKKFASSFGKVIEAQLFIAVVNTGLTTLGLRILNYPYLFALSIVIFLLSLVPVVGVTISLIPLCLIGFQIGGYTMVIYVITMIMIIHAVEAYFLNPKLMAQKTKLPMFYTLIILVFAPHFIGPWGLIIGIPIFVFLLDLLDVNINT